MSFKWWPGVRTLSSRGKHEQRDRNYGHGMGLARSGGPLAPVRRPADLDNFEGKWVAVRDGEVIAVADTSRALVYEVRKLGSWGEGAVAQFVSPPESSFMVGVG